MRRYLTALLDGILVARVSGFGPICWIVRDGLGPNSVDSTGSLAVARFLMTFWWGPAVAALLLVRFGICFGWTRRSLERV
jgi:hypothetical protein